MSTRLRLLFAAMLLLVMPACRRDMTDQAKEKPLGAEAFFANGMASRPLPEHTVARGQLREDTRYFTGKDGDKFIPELPVKLTPDLLQRGRERYDIYCSPCHDRTGQGHGAIVSRGFPAPPSLHIERLRQADIGWFYEVITHGHGVMYSYASRVEPADRWAVAAYIRALQLSQHATLADVDEKTRATLEGQAK